jgi:hypothetical protein
LSVTLGLVVALGVGFIYALPRQAHAATTTTITTCDFPTLSAAIAAASDPDAITPTGPGDTLKFACTGMIHVTSTLLINKSLTLDASGQDVILDGGNTTRVVGVTSTTRGIAVNVILEHLTIAHGKAVGIDGPDNRERAFTKAGVARPSGIAEGGGLWNRGGIVHINHSAFTDNTAIGGHGEDIESPGGNLDGGPGGIGAGGAGGYVLAQRIRPRNS